MSGTDTKRNIFYGSNARRALFVEMLKYKDFLEIEDTKITEMAMVGGSNGKAQHVFNVLKDLIGRVCKLRDQAFDHETAWLPMDAFMTEMREAHQADFAEAKRRWQEANEQEDEETQAAAG
ncbi:hypothetical protein A2239_02775 [Candidatus Uhrbacteria bacterium RIFOXYA2_FULL_40_9]|nr:MAG: hypothetical protein A2239_02775 [Candidatus Uhrbacteria bacterium RIFOXYA2_FULL_40_9]OGL96655.1 MAG: hypothetical protein A2332_01355 [Candidatus Uhrbacteria bacterium RIFOXYB2_FULL_41_18]HCB55852.1 hypothetical protein [Candidatus Uhrbacteria bacterium]